MNIGLIGVGKLGLAYALLFDQRGYSVWASSCRTEYIKELQAKVVHTQEPGIQSLLTTSTINFTVDNHEIIKQCDFIYVMVATPSHPEGDYDVSAVESVAKDLLSHPSSVAGKILVVGSTVNPGTCESLQSLLKCRGVHVIYCPTFSAQGTVLRNIQNPGILSIGTEDNELGEKCRSVFARIVEPDTPIYITHPRTAEILKLAGNCRSTMQISFFNMIGQMLLKQGLRQDLDTAMLYLNFTKRNMQWDFGFGYGGPCYPRDNRSMVHWAKSQGLDYPLGRLIDDFNQQHVTFMVEWLIQDNTDMLPFYFEYISYKPGVALFEESHQLLVAKKLLMRGCTVIVEKTNFLTPEIQSQLETEFGDLIAFENLADTHKRVYDVINHL